jgi:SAM-dependent methyltransferase
MHTLIGKWVHHYVPRPLVNAAWNLASDLKDLPARFGDPRPRPWRSVHNVGGGDFYAQGRHLFALFSELVELQAHHRVLDIGCGAGRLAFPIGAFLNSDGRYLGFDIVHSGLRFARRHVRSEGKVQFVHADLSNREYRSAGQSAVSYRFPVDDGSIDAVVSTSVFTHIGPDTVKAYLDEIGRSLSPNGRAMITAFIVTDAVLHRMATGKTTLVLTNFDEDSWAIDPQHPERAIGFEENAFLNWCRESGLSLVEPIYAGRWTGKKDGLDFQDVIVLQRAH